MANPVMEEREPEPVISSLQPDAEWKNIQQNTFTRWVNNHLKKVPDEITSLETDLSDGLKLIKLVEVLAQRHVGRHSNQVKFRHQKLENVSVALKFLQEDEGIKIINIDSSHIVDQNKKLILGLIWTLILHYSISVHMEEEDRPVGEPDKTPKQRLLQWIRKKLPDDVPVTNFTYDWNDGVALGGLVNSIAPGSVPDWRSWEPDSALENTRHAMKIANDELGVAPLITPEEIINPNVDEKSVMTYLAQFPQVVKEISGKTKEVTPPLPKGKLHDVDPFPTVHRASEFKILMPSDDSRPKLIIQDSHGADIHFTLHKIPGGKDYSVKYTPERLGATSITLYTTSISTGESIITDNAEVTVLEEPRMVDFGGVGKVGDTNTFTVEKAGDGPVEIVVVDGDGNEQKLVVVEGLETGSFSADYPLEVPGLHSINVFHKKTHIQGSPFPLRVLPKCSWEVWGRGIQPDGVCVGDRVPLYVQPSSPEVDLAEAPVSVEITDGDGRLLPVDRIESEGRLKFEYSPTKEGPLHVSVLSEGNPLCQSPYTVSVSSASSSPVRAFGPGLEGGVAEHANVFYVNTHGDSDHLAFTIEGPSKTTIECMDRGNGVAVVEYTPKESGVYKINILSRGEHIRDSPFVVWVDSADSSIHPSAVRVSGLDNSKATKGEAMSFRVDTKNAGADLFPQVSVVDPNYGSISPSVREVNPGLYECSFVPQHSGPHFVNVGVKGVAVPGSPFPVDVREPVDISKLRIFGPGVEGPVVSQQPTHFTIDAKQAGPGAVEVALADRQGRAVDIDVLDNQDGSFTVKYTAPRPGAYQLNVVFAGVDGPPIEINVKPHVDTSGIRVDGLENGDVLIGHIAEFKIDTGKNVSSGKGLQLIAETPDGKKCIVPLQSEDAQHHSGQYLANELGSTRFKLLFDDLPVAEGVLNVLPGQDASKCRASGDGLSQALVGQAAAFRIDTQGAGDGGLALEISGPAEAKTAVADFGNGSCGVEYVPETPGVYQIGVMYGDKRQHIPGSPFTSLVDHPKRASAIAVEGLESPKIRLGSTGNFVVDASRTASAPITATLPVGQQQPFVTPVEGRSRAYSVQFTPVGKSGESFPLDVLYDGEPISGSPFPITLLPESEPQNARIGSAAHEKEVSAGKDAHLTIDTSECGRVDNVKATITGPDGHSRPCSLSEGPEESQYELRWPTDVAGVYSADTFVNGVRVSEEPTKILAKPIGSKYDVIIQDKPIEREWLLGEDKFVTVERLVDDPNAKLTVLKSHPDGIETEVRTESVGGKIRDIVRMRAVEPGKQSVNFVYGGEIVPNGDIAFEAVSHLSEPSRSGSVQSQEEILSRRRELTEEPLVHTAHSGRVEQPFSPSYSERSERSIFSERVRTPLSPGSENRPSAVFERRISSDRRESAIDNAEERYHGAGASISRGDSVDGTSGKGHLFERQFNFNFDPTQIQTEKLSSEIAMPSGGKDHAEIIDNHDGTVLLKYSPKEPGPHELTILHDGAILQGTPIKFFVDSYGTGYATVYGPGLQSASVGEPAHFTVCAKGTHAKELSVSIEGAAQANIKIHDNKDGTCSVSWVPPVPGEYKVHVKLGGKDAKNSPFTVPVAGANQKRAHLSVGSTSEVALNIAGSELKGISASIKSPSGIEEPCFVRMIEGGRLGVSFTPREAGEHLIAVKRDGKLVPKAPFRIKVDKSQVGDASKVVISGAGKSKAISLHDNEILVDTSKAGYGGLSVSVQGPSKAELTCKEVRPGLIAVHYKPTEPGIYVVHIKFADHHVKDSPLTVVCTGKSAGNAQTEIQKDAAQQPIALVGQESTIFLKLPHTNPMDMAARLMDPKGNSNDVEVRDTGDQYYQIKFQPKMEGLHALSVMHKDQHVNGSPFNFTVGSFSEGGPHKVRASGMGVVRGETKHANCFNVYTREAGPGKLSVAIEGPSKAKMDFKDHKDGNCHVEYAVAEPGEYNVAVKYNNVHIPDSPFKVFIAPSAGEALKLELAQFHASGAPVGKAFTFTVLTHRAKGNLEAKLTTPRGDTEAIDIVPIEEGEAYAMRFVPKESGNHYVNVTLDGAPMRDSPFRLTVGGKDECDPTAIHATGEGLSRGTTGQKCEFVINTCNAGAGVLTVQMDGPSKATLDAYELEHGYKTRYTPLAPGDYICAIKYNGIHIPGSPYKIPVDGKALGGSGFNETSFVKVDALAKTSKGTVAVAPVYTGDASKVVAKGAGLNKFFPGRPAMFTLDTGLAGTNLLMVGVVTTKGPCEEVLVKHMGSGHYVVNYKIHDRVKGFIFVKYGDEEIPGSPFAIEP